MGVTATTVDDLSDADRARLEDAHRALHEAVAAYEQFVSTVPLEAGEAIPIADARALAAAQRAVEAAEEHLWALRWELLGWSRPTWAPTATLTADWFSPDDEIYDDDPTS